MHDAERILHAVGGLLIAIAAYDAYRHKRTQPWHGLGVLCIAVGRGLTAARELGWMT